MWSNNNFGNNGIPAQSRAPVQNGAQDNNDQNINYQDNYQEGYQNNENYVPLPSLAAGFPVYPFFPYEYYQPPGTNYAETYMPNLFGPAPGFSSNGFLQTTYTSPMNLVSAIQSPAIV